MHIFLSSWCSFSVFVQTLPVFHCCSSSLPSNPFPQRDKHWFRKAVLLYYKGKKDAFNVFRKYKTGLFCFFLLEVLPIFLFLWNASIQTAACEMFPPSFSGAGDIDCLSSKKSGLPYFWIFILVLSAQGNKCEALSGSSILLTLFFLLFISNT